ncbi:MAG: AAA family ATPase [Candidatus Omnitrophica bacterium]|nr:AAA family ATPase [Candidatus Omnitrophota bacterium]MDD5653653.1 AAA family ATPase [Candidatus Omnitrophota bacterium]
MGHVIAVAGKGGTGKTTIAALIIRLLKESKRCSLLAIDADPNSNLGESLGVETKQTIGSLLDEIAKHPDEIPSGMTKDRFIEFQVQSIISEAEGFDILSMGKPEGPGCYCYVNNVLRGVLSKLVSNYDYVVIDNEAGLEHLSRRTARQVDSLVIISDPTVVGLKAASRIDKLTKELEIKIKNKFLLINRANETFDQKKASEIGAKLLGQIPNDEQIYKISLNGSSLLQLSQEAVSLRALVKIGEKIWQNN